MFQKEIFKRIGEALRSKWAVTLLGLLALSLLIWFGGPLIAIAGAEPLAGTTSRLVVLLVLALLWGGINISHQARNKRQNEQAVKSLLDGDDNAATDEASKREIETLRQRILQALEVLNKSLLNKGKSVYQLPWYILIGPPGTGKTTALLNSGLEFPLKDKLGNDPLSGIGGTRHCDWWFTNKAVLIDTAGRYTTQDSNSKQDARAWLGFLGLLKKYRTRRPINGALITVSLADLLTQTRTERNLHARAIKHRIQELQNQLGMQFPVYVVLTKADLVAGFSEFFADLGREQREQVWGITLPLEADDPEQGVVGQFNKEFHGLLTNLQARLNSRLQHERDIEKRTLIYEFPKQLRLLQSAADDFLKEIFAPNAFEEAAMLRGVYIASATQEGRPIDRVMAQTSGGLGLGQMSLRQQAGESKGFFIKRLLEEIIFPEQNLGSANRHHEKQHVWLTRGAIAGALIGLAGMSYTWYDSYSWNKALVDQAESAVQGYREVAGPELDQETDIVTLAHALNSLRDLPAGYNGTSVSEDQTKGFGLYQGDKLGQPAHAAYERGLQGYLAPFLSKTLEEEMLYNEDYLEYLYETLKTYLMIFDEEHRDSTQIASWFSLYFERKLPGDINAPLRQSLIAHLNSLLNSGFKSVQEDKGAVEQARAVLTKMPLSERAYQRLRAEFLESHIPDFRLTEVLGTDSIRVFQRHTGMPLNQGIPGLYTYNGFHGLFQLENSRIVKRLMEDSWVYGDDLATLGDSAKERIAQEVSQKYYRDYAHLWQELLDDIELRPFSSASQGTMQAKVLAGPEQPLQNLIQAVQKQVRLTKLPVSENAKVAGEVAGNVADVALTRQKSRLNRFLPNQMPDLDIKLPGHEVEAQFADLLELGESELENLQQTMKMMHRYLDHLSSPGNNDKVAYISQLGGKGQSKLDSALYQVSKDMPMPFNGWIQGLARDTSSLAQQGAQTHLNELWRDNVLADYRSAIYGKYPFNRASDQEVTLKDFGRFFGYGGTLDTFFKTYLEPFVDTSKSRWHFEKHIGIDEETLRVFERARRIRNAFFESGSKQPKVEFGLRPAYLDRHISSLRVEVGEKSMVYRHGPTRVTQFTWPTSKKQSPTRIVFTPPRAGRSITETYSGHWGLFRMLDEALSNRSATKRDNILHIALKGNKAQVELVPSSVNHPFWSKELERFSCPVRL